MSSHPPPTYGFALMPSTEIRPRVRRRKLIDYTGLLISLRHAVDSAINRELNGNNK